MSRKKQGKKIRATRPERSSRKGVLIFAAIVIVVLAVAGYIMSQPLRRPGNVGDLGPDFTLPIVIATGLSDQTVTFSSFRGKAVFLEFMVSWCHNCQEMAPSLEYLKEMYRGQEIVFISVAGTQQGATAESTADFIKQYGSTWTYVLDTDDSVFNAYGVDATPTYFIIDGSGTILSRLQGIVPTATFSNAIDQALS